MLTGGNTDQAGAPSSPSSSADRASSDSEPPAATAASPDVMDVIGTAEPWDATPARRTAEPAPLRTSKRALPKVVSTDTPGEAAKSKKKLVKRPTAASTSTTPRKAASDSPHGSESDLEDKPPAPPAKKARKAPAKAMPGSSHDAVRRVDAPSPTARNAKGELPPAEVCYLTTTSFPKGAKKAKGDYSPPQAHLLAANRMFRSFGTETGKPLSAMSYVLAMRELESAKFRMTPAVLMAIFSGRLGSHGLTVLHFEESSELATLEDGSSNVNFSSDFSPSASLPSASTDCATYEDSIDALHGLSAFGQDLWYDHMRKLTSRLRNFVAKKKSVDPDNTRARVRLTLLYVNKFMGTALGFMQLDDPQWWNDFSEAPRETAREREMFRQDVYFALRPTPPDVRTPTSPEHRKVSLGASVYLASTTTLRIQPVPATIGVSIARYFRSGNAADGCPSAGRTGIS
ncbi:hypothetical protein PHYPSEUDO_011562 [Phytophthora pseudosyringae]|uniref:Uncharacterized protein n=1 Tax=Phytophthora pseudosyringae TaxID=221518 RepID=A0A8T1W6D0_9STRA|nr:hypothetical protein PHYPSEUDO_011562 [Phytophthora pseudosyringae]